MPGIVSKLKKAYGTCPHCRSIIIGDSALFLKHEEVCRRTHCTLHFCRACAKYKFSFEFGLNDYKKKLRNNCKHCLAQGKALCMTHIDKLVYNALGNHAKDNGIPFKLKYGEFLRLISGRCCVCHETRATGMFIDMGIHLEIFEEGYVSDNVEAICMECAQYSHDFDVTKYTRQVKQVADMLGVTLME